MNEGVKRRLVETQKKTDEATRWPQGQPDSVWISKQREERKLNLAVKEVILRMELI